MECIRVLIKYDTQSEINISSSFVKIPFVQNKKWFWYDILNFRQFQITNLFCKIKHKMALFIAWGFRPILRAFCFYFKKNALLGIKWCPLHFLCPVSRTYHEMNIHQFWFRTFFEKHLNLISEICQEKLHYVICILPSHILYPIFPNFIMIIQHWFR